MADVRNAFDWLQATENPINIGFNHNNIYCSLNQRPSYIGSQSRFRPSTNHQGSRLCPFLHPMSFQPNAHCLWVTDGYHNSKHLAHVCSIPSKNRAALEDLLKPKEPVFLSRKKILLRCNAADVFFFPSFKTGPHGHS